jgi:hypothetical protein
MHTFDHGAWNSQRNIPSLVARTSLSEHCLDTGSSTARFMRVSRGLYRLKDSA